MDSDSLFWTLTLPSDPRLLASVRGFLEAVCAVSGLDEGMTAGITLAVHEAVANVIQHAHRNNLAAHLQLQCSLKSAGMEIVVHDEGEPFDIDAVPHLDPMEMRLGGRGVFLMRKIMDVVMCRPRPVRGNSLLMFKHFPTKSIPNRPES